MYYYLSFLHMLGICFCSSPLLGNQKLALASDGLHLFVFISFIMRSQEICSVQAALEIDSGKHPCINVFFNHHREFGNFNI